MLPDSVWETLPGTGWLTRPEAELLWAAASATTGPILEVGCYHGRSAVLLASLGRPLHCIDPFRDFDDKDKSGDSILRSFLGNLRERGLSDMVTLHVMPVEDMPLFAHEFGFCYLDGDHSYDGTRRQVEYAMKHKPQAIAVHDVNDSGDGKEIKRACLEILGPWQERVERLAIWR